MNKMKKTGVPWLPEIAEDFSVGYVKQYFYVSKDLSDEGEPERVLKLARAGIVEKDVTTNEGQMAVSYAGYNKVQVGDLLLKPMDLYSGANCNVSELNGVISPAYSNLRAKRAGTVVPKFYDYYFKSQYWLMAMFAHGKGVSFDNRWTLNNDALRGYETPVVPYALQQRIVERIQAEEKKVDTLIANVQTQIEKLKAYKQSVITEIVTKGLDPSVPMKDSGVGLFGSIPATWSMKKFKHISDAIGDGIHSTPNYDQDGDVFFINGNNIGAEMLVFKDDTNRINEQEFQSYKQPLLTANTIFITLNGATYGKTSFYHGEKVLLGKSAGYITLKEDENKEYVRFYLQSHVAKLIMELSLLGTTIPNLSLRTLNEFWIPYPPQIEQQRIVSFLSEKIGQIDRLIAIKQKKIDKLNEYKKSLIYEYVTGKKEVS